LATTTCTLSWVVGWNQDTEPGGGICNVVVVVVVLVVVVLLVDVTGTLDVVVAPGSVVVVVVVVDVVLVLVVLVVVDVVVVVVVGRPVRRSAGGLRSTARMRSDCRTRSAGVEPSNVVNWATPEDDHCPLSYHCDAGRPTTSVM